MAVNPEELKNKNLAHTERILCQYLHSVFSCLICAFPKEEEELNVIGGSVLRVAGEETVDGLKIFTEKS